MSQYNSIEIKLTYLDVILRYDLESLHEVNISNKPVKLDLNWWKAFLFERDLNYSQVIKLPQAVELSIINLYCSHNLAVEESQSIYLCLDLVKLLFNKTEPDFTERDSLEWFRLYLECLAL